MRAAFVINNLNKGPFVYRCMAGALAQTYPCEIIFADAHSTDNSVEEALRAVKECKPGADHNVSVVLSPPGVVSFQSFSDNFMWAVNQTDADWIIQCSSDDYSLPGRTKAVMDFINGMRSVRADEVIGDPVPERELKTWLVQNRASAIATHMYFAPPPGDEIDPNSRSGFPATDGYVDAGEGLLKLAYGSCIAAYSREFLLKVGGFGTSTPDVLYGFLAALDKGFYVVAQPLHIHVQHESVNNLGFQGKLAGSIGDEHLMLEELNHAQLCALYDACITRAMELHPEGVPQEALNCAATAVFEQARGWVRARKVLNDKGLRPMVLA